MRATILHAPGDVRVEDRENPAIQEPTDAIIKLVAACVCGSDLWPYRGADDVELPGLEMFFSHVHLHGGPAPVRDYLPELIDLILRGEINPGKVFDLELPLDEAAEGYKAMDERRAIKVLLRP